MANLSKLFQQLFSNPKNLAKLIGRPANASGQRVFPSRTNKGDSSVGYRIDQGAMQQGGSYNLVVQQNGVAHGETLAWTTVNPDDTGEDVASRLSLSAEENGHKVDDK
jgi:hypothetical protein